MNKLFEECNEEINEYNYYEVCKKYDLDDEISIYIK